MRARGALLYVSVGGAAGWLGGLTAAAALVRHDSNPNAGLILACLSGLFLSAPGGVVLGARRSCLMEVPAGVLMAGAFFELGRVLFEAEALSGNTGALGAVGAAVAFSGSVAALHTWHTAGRQLCFVAALFAGIAALAAVAAGTTFVSLEQAYLSLAAAGGLYGAVLWGAVALSRLLYGVDVESFRV